MTSASVPSQRTQPAPRKRGAVRVIGLLLLLAAGGLVAGCEESSDKKAKKQASGCTRPWPCDPGDPVIVYGDAVAGMAWNDPSVMKEGGGYTMWLSGGQPYLPPYGNPIVEDFRATSANGVTWTIDPTPVLGPGTTGAFDDHRTETPNVIKVGATYHLYYSGCDIATCPSAQYKIGHATSPDGIAWTKDPVNNPVISYNMTDPLTYGFYNTAEPAAVYDPVSSRIFLYYVTLKARPGYVGVPDVGVMLGIAAATSSDGSAFTLYDPDSDGFADAVLTQSAAYPVTSGYVGPSTPWVFIDAGGVFHLYYDMAQYVVPGDFQQVALAHATSTDGFHFTEVEADIYRAGINSWTALEVRSPTVIQDAGVLKMWFAGSPDDGNHDADWTRSGIHYVEHR